MNFDFDAVYKSRVIRKDKRAVSQLSGSIILGLLIHEFEYESLSDEAKVPLATQSKCLPRGKISLPSFVIPQPVTHHNIIMRCQFFLMGNVQRKEVKRGIFDKFWST